MLFVSVNESLPYNFPTPNKGAPVVVKVQICPLTIYRAVVSTRYECIYLRLGPEDMTICQDT